mmetsp:Transcript_47310/g.78505  ORF Transcript_47310/g.78505 Transcript_47310/m.78505 type:complete len:339 (-) Transcript_47310:81-1097(-)|eukprot:CAMPEP_0202713960 /NCGR_PEP_ID=MMETSP1385-20130828/62099_1 /ASSEMBLY_ACC=CAM_ASM_000861 /TAXON_ID=933848 /ORGANISM="Elphidium margaritaceum" /LENGTH=338 /DNA_ID=CAMNT_0049374517 /DNA_START=26 /DNA_END=1042 /DNA_ORIENTATION=+
MSEQDAFITKLTQIAVLQISEELGNEGIRESVLRTLTEVTQRLIQEIGATASSFANASGRIQCNYFDVQSALHELDMDVEELVRFENHSLPLPCAVDIENLETDTPVAQASGHNNGGNASSNNDLERDKHRELEQSISNNACTRNGTVLFDVNKNILEMLEKQTSSHSQYKNKHKRKQSGGGVKHKGHKRLKHIPEYCPMYPDNLLLKHTAIYYKPMAHHHHDHEHEHGDEDVKHVDETQELEQNKQDNVSKTRQCVIDHSKIFSGYHAHQQQSDGIKRALKRKAQWTETKQDAPAHKRAKMNPNPNAKNKNKHKNKNRQTKTEQSAVEILDNPWTKA